MQRVHNGCMLVAIIALGTTLALGDARAMPGGGLELDRSSPAGQAGPPATYPLDTEMVVRQWVMCVSQAVAEDLVRAREESVEQARLTYAKLKDSHSCGQFPELRVILRERTHVSVVPAMKRGSSRRWSTSRMPGARPSLSSADCQWSSALRGHRRTHSRTMSCHSVMRLPGGVETAKAATQCRRRHRWSGCPYPSGSISVAVMVPSALSS